MSYQSKYTGQEIDELLDKVKEEGGSVSVLFDGNAPDVGVSYALSDTIDKYDMITVLFSWNDGLNAKGSYIGTPEIAKIGTIEHSIYRPHNAKANWYIRMTFNSSTSFMITSQEYDAAYFSSAKPAIRGVYGIKFGSGDSTPTGNIISFMGTKAPQGYLICDGTEYNIADYPKLANHFAEQFENIAYFGGDGVNTFKVPDLRNEFLRGFGELSNEVGVHQDATEHIGLMKDNSQNWYINGNANEFMRNRSADTLIKGSTTTGITWGSYNKTTWTGSGESYYTSRPTNVAVLYCIKY